MKTYLVEPRDTVVLRDGRSAEDGATMRTVAFPWPSSIAGLVRTRSGLDAAGRFDADPNEMRKIPVVGPWLVALDARGAVKDRFVPAPVDVVWMAPEGSEVTESDTTLERHRLRPIALGPGEKTDIDVGLELIGFPTRTAPKGKAAEGPTLWSWAAMLRWLTEPADRVDVSAKQRNVDYIGALAKEERVHVAISRVTGTADEGQLFSTEGLRLGDPTRRLAFAFQTGSDKLADGLVHLGGERRISSLRCAPDAALAPPTLKLVGNRFRLVLITPGAFAAGFRPSAPLLSSLGLKLVAAAVGRAQVVSGWDMTRGRSGGPKQSRRLAPAGSAYWVEVIEGTAKDWLAKNSAFVSLAEDAQDKLDGYGHAVVGVA